MGRFCMSDLCVMYLKTICSLWQGRVQKEARWVGEWVGFGLKDQFVKQPRCWRQDL